MVAAGRWRATQPHVEGHAGFRLNALVSLLANASWGKLAAEFAEGKDDPARLQTFVNTILGQGWREAGEELDDGELSGRSESFSLDAVPEAVLALTTGIDVQRDRIEATFVGWGSEGTAYALGHKVIWGRYDDESTWTELDGVLKTRFPHALGGAIGLDAAAIDSGDGETMESVYRFAFPRFSRKIVAIKGAPGSRPWIERSKGKVKGGRLFIVGVDGLKGHILARLARARSIRFSDSLPAVWFEQLASERVVVRYSRGQPQRRFERIPGRAAEALDCMVYAFAARQLVNVNWDSRMADLRQSIENLARKPPRQIRNQWMNR
jgi:phage terminase large subunit GpA-like protein